MEILRLGGHAMRLATSTARPAAKGATLCTTGLQTQPRVIRVAILPQVPAFWFTDDSPGEVP